MYIIYFYLNVCITDYNVRFHCSLLYTVIVSIYGPGVIITHPPSL